MITSKELPKSSISQVNYQSDFQLTFNLKDVTGQDVTLSGSNFTMEFYTSSGITHVASHINGVYSNCALNESGNLVVYFRKHSLPIGALKCKFTIHLQDKNFPDGIRTVVTPFATQCVLVDGAGERDYSATIEICAPILKGKSLTYADLTEEQIQELQRPAIEAAQALSEDYLAEVGSGKQAIARVLTERGVPTSPNASLLEMAERVENILEPGVNEPGEFLGFISTCIEGGVLKVEGAGKYLKAGYVPYIFRYCTKRSMGRRSYANEDGYLQNNRYNNASRKGWNVYNHQGFAKIDYNGVCNFIKKGECKFAEWHSCAHGYSGYDPRIEDTEHIYEYTTEASALMHTVNDDFWRPNSSLGSQKDLSLFG